MDLSKKILIGIISMMVLAVLTTIIPLCMLVGGTRPDQKTASIFVLIFALVLIAMVITNVVVSHREMTLEPFAIVVNCILALIGILFLAGSAQMIDLINNPIRIISGSKIRTGETICLVASLFAVPTAAGAGYLLSL